MSQESNEQLVRSLWSAINEGGVEAALKLTDAQVEWRPHPAGGRVLTSEELLDFFRSFQGERELVVATPYSFHAEGDVVVASGSFRLSGRDRFSEFQIHWVYEFDGERLVRATSFATRSEALQAAGMREGDGQS